ncbi:hypothetical protein [Nostoc sp.]|uniref:hypothetical protein n=1 Tax=Nostoc sp. TaxID=1180 RepID=UPI002FF9382E
MEIFQIIRICQNTAEYGCILNYLYLTRGITVDVPLLPNNSRKTASDELGLFCVLATEKVCKRETQQLLLRHLYLHLSVYPDDVGLSQGENLI